MFKKARLIILLSILFAFIFHCDFNRPTGPSHYSDYFTESEVAAVKTAWSPYVGVHPFGFHQNLQQPHLQKLIDAGMLKGVRLDINSLEAQNFAKWAQGQGIEVLGLFDNKYLRDPNICQILSQHIITNPQITTWQIGNEVGFMSMEKYVEIFKELYDYTKINYPGVILIPQAPSGTHGGAEQLRKMLKAGLDKLCREGLPIIAIHFYSTESLDGLAGFKSQLTEVSISTKIWITETGAGKWAKQINHVKKMYPQLKRLGVERIYWYTFSEDCKKGNALVKICGDSNSAEYSPLMKLLIEKSGNNSTISKTLHGLKSVPDNSNAKKIIRREEKKHNSDKKRRRQK